MLFSEVQTRAVAHGDEFTSLGRVRVLWNIESEMEFKYPLHQSELVGHQRRSTSVDAQRFHDVALRVNYCHWTEVTSAALQCRIPPASWEKLKLQTGNFVECTRHGWSSVASRNCPRFWSVRVRIELDALGQGCRSLLAS